MRYFAGNLLFYAFPVIAADAMFSGLSLAQTGEPVRQQKE